MILSENPYLDDFSFEGVKKLSEKYPQTEQVGILVDGTGTMGISGFRRFYPIKDIHFYFGNLQRRLSLGI